MEKIVKYSLVISDSIPFQKLYPSVLTPPGGGEGDAVRGPPHPPQPPPLPHILQQPQGGHQLKKNHDFLRKPRIPTFCNF